MSLIAILFNDVTAEADDPSAVDVLIQCREIDESLTRLGHQTTLIPCTLDLADTQSCLHDFEPNGVFNLVESLGGTDRLMGVVPLLLDAMQIPYTGSRTDAILRSGDKLRAKFEMSSKGIPTPAWFDHESRRWIHSAGQRVCLTNESVIIKAVFEHASFAMGNDAVIAYQDDAQVEQALNERLHMTSRQHMVEQFVSGREFNLSILEIDGRPTVLAPAEIDFSELPTGLPRIVGASAKWNEDSPECQFTPRRFSFHPSDRPLIERLQSLAIECWELFGLSGYARVDFRVNEDDEPFVLEVNANPCLSSDAGFVAAGGQTGFDFDSLIETILRSAKPSFSRFNQPTTKA